MTYRTESIGQPLPAPAAAPPETPAPEPVGPRTAAPLRFVARYALLALLVGAIGFYIMWDRTGAVFFSAGIARNIIASQAILAVLTLGLLVPLVAGHVDLSVGNAAGLASIMVAAAYADWHLPVWAGIVVGVVTGVAVGALNGLIVTALGVDSFVATLATSSIILAVVSWYTSGVAIIQGIPDSVPGFGSGAWLGLPRIFWVLVGVAVLVWYLLDHTAYGRELHAIGSNREAAKLVGIRVSGRVFGAFVVTGACAGVAGVLLLVDSGAGNPQAGSQFTLTAVAAAFLGAAAFRPGRFNVLGTLVAIYFIAVNVTGLTLAGVDDYIQPLFNGVSLVLAIGLVAVLARRRRRAARPAAGPRHGQG